MKQIGVELFAFYGRGCEGFSYYSESNITIDVDDTTYQTLAAIKPENEEIDRDIFQKAIQAGHKELKKLLKKIKQEHTNMQVEYWLNEADTSSCDILEEYFYEDLENGLYTKPFDELEEDSDPDCNIDEEDDAEDHPVFNFYDYCRDYLEWVKSHTDDYGFIADRVGLDLSAVYENLAELEFTIRAQ